MTLSINTLSIRGKLGVILMIPLLGMIFFSAAWLFEKYKLIEEANALKSLTELIVCMGDAVHALQQERAASVAFLVDSKSYDFQTILNTRQNSDTKLSDFLHRLDRGELGAYGEKYPYVIEDVRYNIHKLNSFRESFDTRGLDLLTAVKKYAHLNQLLFTLAEHLSDTDVIGPVTSSISAYISLLHIKENLELERSLLHGLLSDYIANSSDYYQELVAALKAQESYESIFLSMSTDEQRSLYQKTKLSADAKEVYSARKFALAGEERSQALSDIIKRLGFGGFIHHFQDLLYGGEGNELELISKSYNDVRKNIDRYQSLLSAGSPHHAELKLLRTMLESHYTSASQIQLLRRNKQDISSIILKILEDQKNAAAALDRLSSTSGFGDDVKNWYSQISKKIADVRNIEVQVGLYLKALVTDLSNNMSTAVAVFFISSVTMVLCSLLLGLTLANNLAKRTKKIMTGIQTIASGDFDHVLEPEGEDELGKIAGSFNRMVSTLKEIKSENDKEVWIKTGQMHLIEVMDVGSSLEDFAYQVTLLLCNYLDCRFGAFYAPEDHLSLGDHPFYKLRATVGLETKFSGSEGFKKNKSYLGRCVDARKQIVYEKIPEDYQSDGFAEVSSEVICIVHCPLVMMNRVLGVIELGAQESFGVSQLEYLRTIENSIAVEMNIIYDQFLLEQLLDDFREQTEEIALERSLLEASEKRLHGIFEGSVDGTLIINHEGIIEEVNTIALTQFGYKREELLNQPLVILLPENHRDVYRRFIGRALLAGADEILVESIELIGMHKNGKEIPILISVREIKFECQSIYSVSIRDLLKEKVQEYQLAELIAIYARDQVATPSYSSGSNSSGMPDAANLPTGLVKLEEEQLSLSSVSHEVIDLLDSTAKAQRVRIELSMAENIPDIVYGDKKRTRQIIFKLTSNAIKFSPNGCVVVSLSCANENESDAVIQISIRDNGIGIDEAHLSKIFDVFKQVDSTPARKIAGTDLGLSITKNLVGRMGGDITVQSELGSGSTFTVNLPFKKTGSFSRGVVFPTH